MISNPAITGESETMRNTSFARAGLWWPLGLLVFVGSAGLSAPALFAVETSRPNVIFIMADDQGSVDAGRFGATDFKTPARITAAAAAVRIVGRSSACSRAAFACPPSFPGPVTCRRERYAASWCRAVTGCPPWQNCAGSPSTRQIRRS